MMLLTRSHWAAVFRPGLSPLGHHWDLVDPGAEDARIGHTRRAYKNPAMRLVTVTGLDSGNDIHADVFDGEEKVLRVHSAWRTKAGTRTVALTDPQGALRGSSSNDAEAEVLTICDASDTPVASVAYGKDDPLEVLDTNGRRIARLTRQQMKLTAYSFWDDVVLDHGPNERAREFEATMHTGIRRTARYEIAIDPEAAIAEPVRTLVSAIPLFAGFSH